MAQKFGKYMLSAEQLFYWTKHSYASVNIAPVVPGHAMLISRRSVPSLSDLSDEEVADLFVAARNVGRVLQQHFEATAVTYAVQDGADSGQTVPVRYHCYSRPVYCQRVVA
eukprot:m.71030 g.71030  ORF g.71030 m.71030 type:complete len:111 (+) comp14187_c0_seq9:1156-1488(+)